MAKKGSQKRGAAPKAPAEAAAPAALEVGLASFRRGDYARSQLELAAKAEDPNLPEGVRAQARELLAAMRPDRVALWAGLGCLALYGLVALVIVLTQP
ncbi:MAG: hypothetical protein IT384_08490 [Deltaproteobacteria bacterium]|nr:hypothetical protein [Deltaproteobacteria bacterium]